MGQEELYANCTLCPNSCNVDRLSGKRGVCGETSEIRIAWAGLHRGEEPPLVGDRGSGMVFFCGCPLHCAYCQNYQISTAGGAGITVDENRLAGIFTGLQEMGARTLNLVTGTHYVPSIINALETGRKNGLAIPVVWNSSGYESVNTLRLIDSYVDLYLLDAKTLCRDTASRFCGREAYADAIVPVLSFLKKRHPSTDMDSLKGVLVRHLVFPGTEDQTEDFLKWFAENFRENFLLSLMVQFVPPLENPGFKPLSKKAYSRLLDAVDVLGLDGFVQEQGENEILWIPDFNRDNPFPEGFAEPLPYFLALKNGR